MQVVPSGGQNCNYCKWCHLVAKFVTYACSATWWPKLEPMLIALHVGQICNQCKWHLAGEITQVKESIPWVRCASGNVWVSIWHCQKVQSEARNQHWRRIEKTLNIKSVCSDDIVWTRINQKVQMLRTRGTFATNAKQLCNKHFPMQSRNGVKMMPTWGQNWVKMRWKLGGNGVKIG